MNRVAEVFALPGARFLFSYSSNSLYSFFCAFLRLLFFVSSVIDRSDGESFSPTLTNHGVILQRARTEILKLNVGKLCNLTCAPCHVNGGPKRKEVISWATSDGIFNWLA